MKNKHGFTLAEVLITIGIIGVVAAITIPSLISAYQKRSTESRLKQAYSVLTNALKMSTTDPDFDFEDAAGNGEYDLYENDKYGIFKEYFVPYLQGVSTIEKNNNLWIAKTPEGRETFAANFKNGCYCINNGMCFRMISYGRVYYYIVVDLNGPSRPNVVGKDVFYFALHFKDYGPEIDGKVYAVSANTTNANLRQRCTSGGNGWDVGETCLELIIRNGWKIPNDYPIKF